MRPLHLLLTLAALLLGARYSWATLLLLHVSLWTATRLLQLGVLLVGSGSFWWLLRSYQLQKEQELLDQALLKFKFYSRYRSRAGSCTTAAGPRGSAGDFASGMTDAGFQLRVLKRLPIVAHLRTSWSLPPELCDEIAALVQLIVKDYISFWFQAVSPNDEFPNDVRFLLADLLGAVASRVLEIDSSQALIMVAKSLELLRLHLGWFREAYAQLADEYPAVFEGDENDSNLLKRQEYVAALVQKSPFVHPGCVGTGAASTPASNGTKKNAGENAEAAYLRHVATQLLTQLRPQLGQQHDTNVFVSIAMNLLREITAFKILKPLSEFAQPRYANEVVLSCLQAFVDDKDELGPMSPTMTASGSNGVGMVPTLTLNKLRSTSSFLYKASRRSGVQAEAAFQAVVEAVASAASSAAAGAAEMVFEGDEWADSSNPFAFGSAVFAANAGGSTGDKKAMPSVFAMDERLNVAKAAKMMNPRGFIPGGLLSHKMTGENSRMSAHMGDLKNAKANIGSSLNSSLGKVKRRFRTLGSHPMDPISAPPLSAGAGAAARMIRKPGQLLQKALKRGETGASSPTSSFDDGSMMPIGDSRGRSNAHTMGSLNPLLSPMSDEEEETTPRTASGTVKMAVVRDRVVVHMEKAVASYAKMYDECPEMRSSARSRELYELLSAMEDAFMLGFRNHDSRTPSSEEDADNRESSTPPMSPSVGRRSSLPFSKMDLASPRRDSLGTNHSSDSDGDLDERQYYWEYLARDRHGADKLNSHWRFVASQCPDCSPSSSFVSTRGVQWMLTALEKRALGGFCAELQTHDDMTELFYESYALFHDRALMKSVLTALAQLDKLKICLDVPVVLGRLSELDQELGVSPSSQPGSRGMTSPSTPVRVLERVWETERYVPMNGWVKASDKRWQELPSSEWIWEDDWMLESAGTDAGESSDSEAPSCSWEYAKTFEDTFHEKEKKFDSVRRRRWVRRRCQLPPVLVLAALPASFGGASSPLSPSTVPSGIGRARKLKQRFNALTHKGAAAKKPFLRARRSKSFDKEMPESLSMLGMMDSDDSQHTSAKTSVFMKARASIPSLPRGISNKSTKAAATETHSLSSKPSTDDVDDPAALYDNDEEDDENLCFRCLQALPASKSGVGVCQSCHQRVCASCLDFFAFMVYPPPLETSKKARVCGTCYDRLVSKYKLRIEAHVGKYLIKEREREMPDLFSSVTSNSSAGSAASGSPHHSLSPTTPEGSSGSFGDPASPLSPTLSRAGSTKFEITVKIKDDSAYAWSVVKSFHDFEVLEKQLTEKLKKQEKKCGVGCQACHLRGVDYVEMTAIKPSLKTVAAATLVYDKRLYVLEQFLQQLLACDTLCQSSVVQKFLLLANAYGSSPASGSLSVSGWEGGENPASPSAVTSTGGMSLGGLGGAVGAGAGGAGGVLVENGKWKKGRWIAPDANSKETKMRVLQKIEVSLFAVLGEVFEFDGIGMVRRQIFSMTRSFIKAFLGASHFRMLERQFLSFTDPKKLSGWIGDLRLYLFPDPSDASVAAPDTEELRKDCLEAILASFPSKALSLFGDTACENAALKLHEFLQHEVFVKNLLFSVTDELLLHLFPESTTFKGKKAPAGGASPASPTPASPSAIQVATTIAKEAVAASIDDDVAGLVALPFGLSPLLAASSHPASRQEAQGRHLNRVLSK